MHLMELCDPKRKFDLRHKAKFGGIDAEISSSDADWNADGRENEALTGLVSWLDKYNQLVNLTIGILIIYLFLNSQFYWD